MPAALLSADPIDTALLGAGVLHEQGIPGYEVMKALAREQVAAGLSAVIDAVNPFRFVRQAYVDIAAEFGAPIAFVMTVCSDRVAHRQRVEERHRSGIKDITWARVERQIAYYEPVDGGALTLDSMNASEGNVLAACDYVRARVSL